MVYAVVFEYTFSLGGMDPANDGGLIMDIKISGRRIWCQL